MLTSWRYDESYGCFFDSTNSFCIDSTCCFFTDKFCNWKKKKQGNGFLPIILFILMLRVLRKGVKKWFHLLNNIKIIKNFLQYIWDTIWLLENLLDYTNLFSLNDFKVNGCIICKYFKNKCDRRIRKSSI